MDSQPEWEQSERPNVARVYDYLLGSVSNFRADREMGERMVDAERRLPYWTRANRDFLRGAMNCVLASAVAVEDYSTSTSALLHPRMRDEVLGLFDGWTVQAPGVAFWRPGHSMPWHEIAGAQEIPVFVEVGIKQ